MQGRLYEHGTQALAPQNPTAGTPDGQGYFS